MYAQTFKNLRKAKEVVEEVLRKSKNMKIEKELIVKKRKIKWRDIDA